MRDNKNWHERAYVATNGIKFECQRCCKCCYGEVILSYSDIVNIRKNDEKLMWAIIPTTSPRYPQQGEFYSIMHTSDPNEKGEKGYCAYLEDGACRVYSGRPMTCRTYPFSVELKKKMKKKRKLHRHVPVFFDPKKSMNYVVVFDPECPGIGKGSEVNLEQIASVELDNISKVTETYKTDLKNKINDLIYPEEMKRAIEEYKLGMKILVENRKVKTDTAEENLFIYVAYNPKDIIEEDAKKLVTHAIGIWNKGFPEISTIMIYYTFPVGSKNGLIEIYVGVIPLKSDSVTPMDLEVVFSALMVSEELRKKSKTKVGFANVRFENGQWITPN